MYKATRDAHPDLLNLLHSLQARFSLIHIPTREEDRLVSWLVSRRNQLGGVRSVKVWSVTGGLVPYDPDGGNAVHEDTRPPGRALAAVQAEIRALGARAREESGTLYIFRDLHPHYRDLDVVRRLRDLARDLRGTLSTVILVSPEMQIPAGLETEVEVCDFPLPSREVIETQIYDRIIDDLKAQGAKLDDSSELREAVLRAATGLTFVEANNALAKAIVECRGLTPEVVGVVNREKKRFVRRIPGLDFVPVGEADMHGVGGLDVAKQWLDERKHGLDAEAARFGLEPPKGVTMLGLPGTGKSLTAKALAHQWRLPLLRLDISALKEGVVGRSENNLKAALKVASSIGNCILWLDELEKAFAGAGASYVGDSGVSKGMFGMFLTWLQEQSGVFVYATANDISALPPEFLRKGRIDEVFFVHFPTTREREEILAIHLRKRGRNPDAYDLARVARCTATFVGAELEQIVKDALYKAYHERTRNSTADLRTEHLLEVAERMVPLSHSMTDRLRPILKFVEEGRAVRASSERDALTEAKMVELLRGQISAERAEVVLAGVEEG